MKKYLISFLINFIFFFIITITWILSYINPRILQGETLSNYSNNYCKNNSNIESIICKNKYKKNKFILLLIDGTAFDSLKFLYNP